jgi:spore germination cell wall hydrolase CwlJ-like protein
MTSLTLGSRRFLSGLIAYRLEALAVGILALAVTLASLLAFRAPAEAAPEQRAVLQLTPAKAAAMVAATSAAPGQIRATGEQAKLINAALPFSAAPVQAAQPFALAGDALDHDRALLCLTQAVYYEAGFEPIDGRRAVAQVVLNRMRHPAFPNSVCGVVYQGSRSPVCQFSFVCDGSLYRAPSPAAWRVARDIAAAALAGHVERSVGSATHYHANYVAPRWAPMLTKITQLGAHIFYRWPGAWGQRGAFNGRYAGEAVDPSALRPSPRTPESADLVVTHQAVASQFEAGPPVARAPNDVGGLLDTSKGWTLSIPDPKDIGGSAARTIAQQQVEPKPAATSAAAVGTVAAAPIVAGR